MACEIKPQDVQLKLEKEVAQSLGDLNFSFKDGVLESRDLKESEIATALNVVDRIESDYSSDVLGEVIEIQGNRIRLLNNPLLAEAMTIQSLEEETKEYDLAMGELMFEMAEAPRFTSFGTNPIKPSDFDESLRNKDEMIVTDGPVMPSTGTIEAFNSLELKAAIGRDSKLSNLSQQDRDKAINKKYFEIVNKVNSIIDASRDIKLLQNESGYKSVRKGTLYTRVTTFISNYQKEELEQTPILTASQKHGNRFDEYLRNFFNGTVDKNADYYKNLTSDKMGKMSFEYKLGKLKEYFDDRQEIVIPMDILLHDDTTNTAGTVDLLTVDSSGDFRIYDIKTMRGEHFVDTGYGTNKYDSEVVFRVSGSDPITKKLTYSVDPRARQDSKRKKHQKQLSLYSMFLERTYGIKTVELGIIPIEIQYEATDPSVTGLKMLDIIPMERLENVNGMSVNSELVGPTNVDFPLTKNIAELIKYKTQEVRKTQNLSNALRGKIKLANTEDKRAQLIKEKDRVDRRLQGERDQLDYLTKNQEAALFSGITSELTDIQQSILRKEDVFNVEAKLNQLHYFIKGRDMDGVNLSDLSEKEVVNLKHLANKGLPTYDSLNSLLDSVVDMYSKAGAEMFREVVKEDVGYVKNVLDKIKGLSKRDLGAWKDLLYGAGDIDSYSQNLLGIDSSMGKASVIFQLIPNIYNRALVKYKAEFKSYKDAVNTAYVNLSKAGVTEYEWLMQRNDAGAPLGTLIDRYSPPWFAFKTQLNQITFAKGATPESKFSQQSTLINREADVIIPQKLKFFKDLYGADPAYSQYFTHDDTTMEDYEKELRALVGDAIFENELEGLATIVQEAVGLAQINEGSVVYKDNQRTLATNPFRGAEHLASGKRDIMVDGSVKSYPDINFIKYLPKRNIVEDYDALGDPILSTDKYFNADFDTVEQDPLKMELWKAMREGYRAVNNVYSPNSTEYLQIPFKTKSFSDDMTGLNTAQKIKLMREKGWKGVEEWAGQAKEEFYDRGSDSTTRVVTRNKEVVQGPLANYENNFTREVGELSAVLKNYNTEEIKSIAIKEGLNYSQESLEQMEKNNTLKSILSKDIARTVLYDTYSKKFVHNTSELFDLASQHAARQEAQPKIKVLRDAYARGLNSIDDSVDEDIASGRIKRDKGLSKMDVWITTQIENRTYHANNKFEKNKGKYLSNTDITGTAFEKGLRNVFSLSYGKVFNTKAHRRKKLENPLLTASQMKLLSNQEKVMVGYLDKLRQDVLTKTSGMAFSVNNKEYIQVLDKGNIYRFEKTPAGSSVAISEDAFDKAFTAHMEEMADDLGVALNMSSLSDGMLFISRLSKLGFQPLAGAHNRLESKIAMFAINNTGEFFPRGAMHDSNAFLAGVNTFKMTNIDAVTRGKKQEFDKLFYLMENLGIEQSNLNDLDKLDNTAKLDTSGDWNSMLTNPYMAAIGYPEFKNQAAVMLSVMSGQNIRNNKGEEFPLFDGTSFPAFEMDQDNILRLKPEFRQTLSGKEMTENIENWENFSIMDIDPSGNSSHEFELFRRKVNTAIKRTQGNYDNNDIIRVSTKRWGKILTFFFKWAFEQTRLKWGAGGTYNLTSGEIERPGRYYDMMASQPLAGFLGFGSVAAMSLGLGSIPAAVGLGALGLMFVIPSIRKFTKGETNLEDFQLSLRPVHSSLRLLQSILIESVNLPLHLTNTGRVKFFGDNKARKLYIENNSFANMISPSGGKFGYTGEPLDQVTADSLEAFSKDIASVIWFKVALPFIISLLFFDADDEGDSWKRKFMNFLLNNTDRLGGNVTGPMNPVAFHEDLMNGILLSQVTQLTRATGQLMTGSYGEASKSATKVFLPKFMHVPMTAARDVVSGKPLRGFSETASGAVLDDQQWNKQIQSVGWAKDINTGGDYSAKKELVDVREQAVWYQMKQLELEGVTYDDHEEWAKAARKRVGTKPRNMGNQEAIEQLRVYNTYK